MDDRSGRAQLTPRLRAQAGLLLVLVLVHALVPDGWPTGLAYAAAGGASAAVTHLSIRRHRPSSPRGWRLIELALWFVAAYGLALACDALLPDARWPARLGGAADLLTNALVLGAALHFLRVRRPGHDREALLDAGSVVLAGSLLVFQLGYDNLFATPSPRLVPLASVLLLAAGLVVGLRLCFTEHWPRSFLPLLAGAALGVLGNVAQLAVGTAGFAPRAVQSLWLGSSCLAAVAAALPDMRLLGEPEQPRPDGRVSPYRLLGLSAALLASPALVLLDGAGTWQGYVVASGLTALTALVIWRIARLLAERERMRHALLREVAERKTLQAQLVHQATHDDLTGLPTRALFMERLEQAVAGPECTSAVLCVDLDGFKAINDDLGHLAGDELLHVVGARLRTCLRAGDLAARLGGDEFGVLVDARGEPTAAVEVAERILATLRQPIVVRGTTVRMAASVGIASCAGGEPSAAGSLDATTLLERADATMYAAKNRGKGHYRVWRPPPLAHPARERPRPTVVGG